MNSQVRCPGCKQYRDRAGMQKVGLGYVCDAACMELVKEKARDKRARRHKPNTYRTVPPNGDQRRRVRKRDGERCRWCGGTSLLAVHHVLYRSQGGPNSMDNLITLCVTHHELVHTNKRIYQPLLLEVLRLTEAGEMFMVPEVMARLKAAG